MESKKCAGGQGRMEHSEGQLLVNLLLRDCKMLKFYGVNPWEHSWEDYVCYIYKIPLNTTPQHTLELIYCSATQKHHCCAERFSYACVSTYSLAVLIKLSGNKCISYAHWGKRSMDKYKKRKVAVALDTKCRSWQPWQSSLTCEDLSKL